MVAGRGQVMNIDDLIAEHEKDPEMKRLLDEARANLKKQIEEAGGLQNLIEVEPWLPPNLSPHPLFPNPPAHPATEDN